MSQKECHYCEGFGETPVPLVLDTLEWEQALATIIIKPDPFLGEAEEMPQVKFRVLSETPSTTRPRSLLEQVCREARIRYCQISSLLERPSRDGPPTEHVAN